MLQSFEKSQFTNKETKKRLKCDVIPTLFDIPNPLSKITPSQPLEMRNQWQRKR